MTLPTHAQITNDEADFTDGTKLIDFCGIVLVGAGDNLPCVRLGNETVHEVLASSDADPYTEYG